MKYSVQTQFGTFTTRETIRKFTHVVITRGLSVVEIQRRASEKLAYTREQVRRYVWAHALAESTGQNVSFEGNQPVINDYGYPAEMWLEWLDSYRREIDESPERTLNEVKAARAAAHSAYAWASSLELARGRAYEAKNYGHADVLVIDVVTGKAVL